jgi:hypothetical protein
LSWLSATREILRRELFAPQSGGFWYTIRHALPTGKPSGQVGSEWTPADRGGPAFSPPCPRSAPIVATLVVELPEFGSRGRRPIAALGGLAPFPCDSGERRGHRAIRGGRADVRKALFNAARVGIQHNPIIPMAKGFFYLAVVLDWFSRRILSWHVSITMEASFCVETLGRPPTPRAAGSTPCCARCRRPLPAS